LLQFHKSLSDEVPESIPFDIIALDFILVSTSLILIIFWYR